VRLTELGLGGSQLGNLYRAITDDDARRIVNTAWDIGIRHFDTAPHYGLGLSERRLGALLGERPRDEYVLSSKVGRLLEPVENAAGAKDDEGFDVPATMRRRWDFTRDGVRRSVQESLDRLGLDRIDIAYLHDPENHWEQALAEALPALIELREEGVVRAIGAGMNFTEPLVELIRDDHGVDVVMCAGRYTLLEQAEDLVELASERGVGLVAVGVYNSGLLALPRPGPEPKYNYKPAPAELVARVEALAAVCESHGVTLPEAALAFPLRHPAVISVVVGAASSEQVVDAADRYHRPIPDGLWSDLAAAGLISTRAARPHPTHIQELS
jgi:D-threo-aldose 1-dehydrogenase